MGGGVIALGLLAYGAVSLFLKDDPLPEEGSLSQAESLLFRPPTTLYQTIDPNSGAAPETVLDARAEIIADMRAEALALVKHLMTMFPLDENADVLQGDIYENLREDALSMVAWKRALAKNPQRTDLYEKLGEVAAAQGNQEQAFAYWNQGLQTNANAPNLRWHIANAYLEQGQPEPGVQLLTEECRLSPQTARNYFLLGQCYRQMQQFEQAALNYQKATEIAPDYYNAYYGLANVCRMMKETERAKEALEKFRALKQRADASEDRQIKVEEMPQFRRRLAAYYIKGYQLYAQNRKVRQGKILLQRAAAVAPDWPMCLEKLATHHYHINRLDEAIKFYRQAQRLDPNQPMYAVNVGTLYRQLRRYDLAEKAFRQAIRRFPDYSPGYRELIFLNMKTEKNLSQTLSLAQTAVQLKGSADDYYILSQVHRVNGNGQAALSAIQEAIRLDPDNAEYRSYDAIIRRPGTK